MIEHPLSHIPARAIAPDPDEILRLLSTIRSPQAFNPYNAHDSFDAREPDGSAAIRRERLRHHLATRASATYILVGEALGHRGGRCSGVPLTSEWQLTGRGMHERTSQVVHEELINVGVLEQVVFWNVCMLHPFHQGNPTSNRKPTRKEILLCSTLLSTMCAHRTVLALGKIAALATGGIPLRHPAHGGEREFRAGLRDIFTAGGS